MSRMRTYLLVAVVAVLAGVAGGAAYWFTAGADKPAVQLDLTLPDPSGQPLSLSQFRGKVVVVNFWATWCAPCREEIPLFVAYQQQHGAKGLQFVGIAIDQPAKVQMFAKDFGINYPLMIGNIGTMEWSQQAGNRAGVLPFTLVFDRQGKVVARQVGEIKPARLAELVLPLL